MVPGTPLWELQERGEFELPGKFEMLAELRTIVAGADMSACRFASNHASNYVHIRGMLSRDRNAMVAALDRVIAAADERLLKPEWMRGL